MMRISPLLKVLTCAAALQIGAAATVADDGKSPWQIRVRAISVTPDESSTIGTIGGQATVDSSIVPELDITYFWSDHFATELILATSKHKVGARGTSLGNLDLGHTWVLPPTLTFQYHINPHGDFRPYVGAGINYTIFHSENKGAVNSISYKDSFGFALQAGTDIKIDDNWVFNLDVKKLFLDTDVTVNGTVKADVNLNPWVFGAGFGYRF